MFNISVNLAETRNFDFCEFMTKLKLRHIYKIKTEETRDIIICEIRQYFVAAVSSGVIEEDFAKSIEKFIQDNLWIN